VRYISKTIVFECLAHRAHAPFHSRSVKEVNGCFNCLSGHLFLVTNMYFPCIILDGMMLMKGRHVSWDKQ
jgi:hypothetical protein